MNTDCRQLEAFLNGELSDPEIDEFNGHMETCANCHEAYQAEQDFDQLLKDAWKTIEIPSAINASKPQRPAPVRSSRRWRLLEICAAITLLAILIISDSINFQPFAANENREDELVFHDDDSDTNLTETQPAPEHQPVQFLESEDQPYFIRTREQTEAFTIVETHLTVQPSVPISN